MMNNNEYFVKQFNMVLTGLHGAGWLVVDVVELFKKTTTLWSRMLFLSAIKRTIGCYYNNSTVSISLQYGNDDCNTRGKHFPCVAT